MKRFFMIFPLFVLIACTVGPDYEAPKTEVSDEWAAHQDQTIRNADINLEWWEIFDDPLLEKYIYAAAWYNKDVEITLANLRRARALRDEASSGLLPSFSASTSGNRSQSSGALSSFTSGEIRNTFDAGFDASWEVDIFGGIRREVEAADARLEGALADYHAALLSSLSEVARSYYEARGLQKRIAITEKNANLFNQTLDLIEARLEIGEASEFDATRARAEYELTQARIPNLRADLQSTIFSLSVLLGQPPEALLEEMQNVKPLPAPPDLVPVGLRSDILRRRPDIKVAERELAASIADIGAQEAELFPQFFITGDIGRSALSFGDLFDPAAKFWSFAGLIDWSLFEGGAIRAQIDVQEAEAIAALKRYEKTVLEALADVETALTQYGRELETRKRLATGVQSRQESSELARQLYEIGEEDFLAVLDVERELTASEDDLVVSETQSIIKLISLYTALGGGWQALEEKDVIQKDFRGLKL